MCINDGNPHFGFDHSNIYYSTDIDYGIPATTTPAVGDTFSAKVTVNNDGVTGSAQVMLCVCPPGTSITTVITHGEAPSATVDACDGVNGPGVLPFTIPWTVPSGYSHFCLAAMVKNAALGGGGYDSPLASTTDPTTFTIAFDPNRAASAQCNVSLVQGGGRPNPPSPGPPGGGGQHRWCTDFAFAVGNPLRSNLRTQIVANPVGPRDERIIEALKRQSHIRAALELGRFQPPAHAGLAVGRERILQPTPGSVPCREDERATGKKRHLPPPATLGHFGEVTHEIASRLAVTPFRPEQTMNLVVDEVRQGLVHICAPPDARPGDLFAVDIRHELLARPSAEHSRVIGGLAVILRIPHPEDREIRRRG